MYVIFWMLGAVFLTCLMGLSARELSGQIDTLEILFFRSFFGFLAIMVALLYRQQTCVFRSSKISLHIFRNFFHFFGQYGWVIGIGLLPLAQVVALEFTMPIWVACIATIFLKEQLNLPKILAIGLGLLGVVLITKPNGTGIQMASCIVLGAAVCHAIAYTSTKSLSLTDSPLSVLFFMYLVHLPVNTVLMATVFVWPNTVQWLWLTGFGLTGFFAHFCLTKAIQAIEVSTVAVLDFLRLPLIASLGTWLYDEPLDGKLLLGGVIILLGNLINLRQAKLKIRTTTP